ncbi:hypothetical protein AAVH_41295, partial [Aphelenchoides avenae]
ARLVEERIEAVQSRWQEELENVKKAQQKQSRSLTKTKKTAENAYERTENNEIELNRCKLFIGALGPAWKEKEEQGVLSAKDVCCRVLTEAFNQKYTAVHIKDAEVRWSKNKKRAEVIATFNRRDQRDDVFKKFEQQQKVFVSPSPGSKDSWKINIDEVRTERQNFVRKAALATVSCLNMWRKGKVEAHPSTDAELSGHSNVAVNGKKRHYEEWYAELKLLVSRDGFKDGPLGSRKGFCSQFEMIGLASTVAKRLPFMSAEERESYDLPPYSA